MGQKTNKDNKKYSEYTTEEKVEIILEAFKQVADLGAELPYDMLYLLEARNEHN